MTSSLPRKRSTPELQQQRSDGSDSTASRRRSACNGPAGSTGSRHCRPRPILVKRKNWPVHGPSGRPGRPLSIAAQPPPRAAAITVSYTVKMLAQWTHHVRESLAAWPAQFRQWREELRHDPTLLWRTAAVRVGFWLLLGIGALLGASWLSRALVPRAGGGFEEATPLATLHVVCTNAACRKQFTTRQPMNFADWPLTCPDCNQLSVYRATLCSTCGTWFAVAPGGPSGCPACAARAAPPPPPPAPEQPKNLDDLEDPWK